MATPPVECRSRPACPGGRCRRSTGMRLMSLRATPRTSTPLLPTCEEASAWPSTSGIASLTPGTWRSSVATCGVVGRAACRSGSTKMWPLRPTILLEQLAAEAVHHRHHDDQRRDAEHDAEEGEAGDDRDEALAPARAQIAQRHHPFEAGEGRVPVGRSPRRSLGDGAACRPSRRSGRQQDAPRRPRRETSSRSPVGAALELDLALRQPLRADDHLPGHADQIGGGELARPAARRGRRRARRRPRRRARGRAARRRRRWRRRRP